MPKRNEPKRYGLKAWEPNDIGVYQISRRNLKVHEMIPKHCGDNGELIGIFDEKCGVELDALLPLLKHIDSMTGTDCFMESLRVICGAVLQRGIQMGEAKERKKKKVS